MTRCTKFSMKPFLGKVERWQQQNDNSWEEENSWDRKNDGWKETREWDESEANQSSAWEESNTFDLPAEKPEVEKPEVRKAEVSADSERQERLTKFFNKSVNITQHEQQNVVQEHQKVIISTLHALIETSCRVLLEIQFSMIVKTEKIEFQNKKLSDFSFLCWRFP